MGRYTPISGHRGTPTSGNRGHLQEGANMFYGGKYDAQDRYDEWNTTQVKLKLNNKTDKDILAWIQKQKHSRSSSAQGAIKALIREDIAEAVKNFVSMEK